MKKFPTAIANLLFIHIMYLSPLYSEVNVIFQPYLFSSQDLSSIESPIEERKRFRDRESSGGTRVGISANFKSKSSYWEGGLDFLTAGIGSKATDLQLIPGRDAYLGFNFPLGDLWIGRKSFYREEFNPNPIQETMRNEDGGDGIGIQSNYFKNSVIQLFLWDYYSGFPLWYFNQTPVYSKVEKTQFLTGDRHRQGIRIFHKKENWKLSGDIFYLNLGNWGRSSRDDLRLQQEEGGDGDFLLRNRIEINYTTETWEFGFEYHITRGLDKTFAAPNRPERSLPIRGEAMVTKISWKNNDYFFNLVQFLPNTPTTGDSIEPLTIGYVGMGNSYSLGHFFARERNLFPSVWVTPWGKEWNNWDRNSLFGTRAPASFTSLDFGIKISDWNFGLWGEYMLPRKILLHDKGQISIRNSDYERYFLAESGIRIQYGNSKDIYSSQLGLEFSHFWSQDNLSIRGNFTQVYGRFIF